MCYRPKETPKRKCIIMKLRIKHYIIKGIDTKPFLVTNSLGENYYQIYLLYDLLPDTAVSV